MSGPTREQVMAWAQHVGMADMSTDVVTTTDELERFAALAYAAGQDAEREACAKVCDLISTSQAPGSGKIYQTARRCGMYIRMRDENFSRFPL